jgi:hypothetical protein
VPRGQRPLYRMDDLLVDRLAGLDLDRKWKHITCIMYTNTRNQAFSSMSSRRALSQMSRMDSKKSPSRDRPAP